MKKILTLTIAAIAISFASFALTPITPSSGGACVGSYINLSDSTTLGGTWSSSNTAIATVNTTGNVLGISAGVVTITYTVGSSYVTGTYTFNPTPTAIAGPTSLCAGTSVTLTDATPGGTWSTSSSYVATINSATGLLTGAHTGSVLVYYSVGGCSVYHADTVTGGSTGMIMGASVVCPGSTITLFDSGAVSTGWSSSNTGVATIGTDGVVTGVAAGTTTISLAFSGGSCGTTYATHVVTVGTATPGTITGGSSVAAGSTLSLYLTGGTGTGTGATWTSSNTAIATVSGSGVVTGVSAGSVVITYSFTTCSTVVSTTANITVTAIDGISGHVNFSTTYNGNVKVWLITYNPTTFDLEASDSMTYYCSGTSVYYQFLGLATDSFRVKAAGFDSTFTGTGFIPTYHTSNFYWHDASVINHVTGTADINEDINMVSGAVTSGPGFIGGNVTTGANKTTSGAIPSIGLKMNIVNSASSQLMGMTRTDASGNYSFSNLPVGATYYVFPDSLNYATTAYTSISLTTAAPSMTVASFTQHTLSKTITPGSTLSAGIIANAIESVIAFPNPSNGKLNIQWTLKATEKANITVSDVTGRQVYNSSLNMSEGTATTQLDLSALSNGLYLISIKSASVSYNSKIQIQH